MQSFEGSKKTFDNADAQEDAPDASAAPPSTKDGKANKDKKGKKGTEVKWKVLSKSVLEEAAKPLKLAVLVKRVVAKAKLEAADKHTSAIEEKLKRNKSSFCLDGG